MSSSSGYHCGCVTDKPGTGSCWRDRFTVSGSGSRQDSADSTWQGSLWHCV